MVTIRSSAFWDIMLCTLVKVNEHFGVTYCLHLQGQRLTHILFAACFVLVSLLSDPEEGGDVSPKNGLLSPDYKDIIFQNKDPFI